jgi:hypothetical protein
VTVGVLLFVLMLANYALNAMSIRLCARGRYLRVAGVDACIALLGFGLIQEVAHSRTLPALVGYVCGGVAGSMIGMYLTRKV